MLDLYDRKILALLQRNAEMPVAEIAAEIGLTTTPCWRRIRKLEERGYFKRRVALLDEEKLNVGVSVFMAIRTNQHSRAWSSAFVKATEEIPEIVDIFRLAGEIDYMLRVVVPDIATFDRVYQRLIQKVEIHDVSSMFAMETIKSSTELPLDYA
ncbi:Lrp/AsnC family transcriptional regulator [Yangia mangrovi]|uniref:Lrp/AsnC family transcriptional regulator n=2 Tax=Alloyangia mangrovi TaxID=1779329 RepID=A0ABT2KKM9_9RHOB|nr:Lrp/AsnC family transcriptional regulator [Alloyangia mangrovi]MCA0939756.1 Lrp/AsnC family transcriptional regulator [Alloyangia pacifica]MCA0944896.1 Lrp/AsnC family transcriptional regulator [Alloyangia pacifica]MCT4370656.1 Lrp/AsnC family transcriptional regulator [Alloyangia mangrovi]